MNTKEEQTQWTGIEIAVIGMAGRFPGAGNIYEFWENLKNGVESVVELQEKDLEEAKVNPQLIANPNWVRVKAMMDDIEYFDSSFFGYTPKEADLMNPSIRIFHECAWEAFEDSGYNPKNYKGTIGLYAGGSNSVVWEVMNEVSGRSKDIGGLATFQLSDKDYLGTRVAFNFNLMGPALMVQTACSTSLVATHLACQSILNGECRMALAGGVSVFLGDRNGYLYHDGSIKAKDGHCRTFDAKASGTVFGSGAGAVVLKALEDAIEDRDHIYAVIRGTAINNDGSDKAAFPAPSVEGQARVIRMAQQVAEVDPETITYLEAHGTGTILGDPIEIEALKKTFNTEKRGYCAIGSAKTNVGHLDAAAGVTGLIKTALALQHRMIPPSLNYEIPNPKIDFESGPFFVNTQLRHWKNQKFPLRAGVSAFGVGGTNAHAVMEEAPPPAISSDSRTWKLLLISAKTKTSLEKNTENLAEYFRKNPEGNLADAAYTLQAGRRVLERRRMLVCGDVTEALELLDSPSSESVLTFASAELQRPVTFMFSGQGSQYVNMGWDIYRSEKTFKEAVDLCFEILKSVHGIDLESILFPGKVDVDKKEELSKRINQTEISQLVIFTIEYALSRLLMKWGITPYAMIGHSIGEYVAAMLAGVFSLEDALRVVLKRGQLMQRMSSGSMLSVPLSEEELMPLLPDDLELAAANSSSLCVVSGSHEAIEKFAVSLKQRDIDSTKLHTSHAFHSRMMEPILEEFKEEIGKITLNKPEIPYISNLTGTWIGVDEVTDPAYWAQHIRRPVRFNDGLAELLKEEQGIFVEVGPGKALATFVRQHADKKPGHHIINMVRHPKDEVPDDKFLLGKIGELWLYGQAIDWVEFYSEERRNRLPLPTYSFERLRYWTEDDPFTYMDAERMQYRDFPIGQPQPEIPRKKEDIADWFYLPTWERLELTSAQKEGAGVELTNWLVFMNDSSLGRQLERQLKTGDKDVIVINAGDRFAKVEDSKYVINPAKAEDYDLLFDALKKSNKIPHVIVHLWNCEAARPEKPDLQHIEEAQNRGFYSLVHIAQAIGKESITGNIRIGMITRNMQEVSGEESLHPEQATVLGPVKIIPREYANIGCKSIDIVHTEPGNDQVEKLAQQLREELAAESEESVIAYRDNRRWVQTFKPRRLEKSDRLAPQFKNGGVYLITGGLGGIGLVVAEDMAGQWQPKLILTGRSSFPAADEWEQWLAQHEENDPTSRKIKKLQDLEQKGAQVMVGRADVSNLEEMREVITQARERFGTIDGVIHSAGVPDGGVIQLRNRSDLQNILDPKVNGTLVLDALLRESGLEFFILFSSTVSIMGPVGQVGYAAANSFLDAFAHYNTSNGTYTVSINWDAWKEVGMAVNAVKQMTGGRETPVYQKKDVAHPLFEYRTTDNSSGEIYVSHFTVDRYWLLDEHRIIMGKASLPGTGYLEMVRAAAADQVPGGAVEVRDINFLKPLLVQEGAELEVHTVLEKNGDSFDFTVKSRPKSGQGQWEHHAMGKVANVEEKHPVKYELKEIEGRCDQKQIAREGESFSDPKLFGPRWNSCQWIKSGQDEWLGFMSLPEAYNDDVDHYPLHPALLDVAVGFISILPESFGGEPYLPFAYKRVRINGPLPSKIYSLMRYSKNIPSSEDVLVFDVTIMDPDGIELVEVEGYTFRKVALKDQPPAKEIQPVEKYENFSLQMNQIGDLDKLAFWSIPRQKPGPGEIEFEVLAIGLNFKDVLFALAVLPLPPNQNIKLGVECTGRVVAVGEGVDNVQVGDEILALKTPCFKEYVTMPATLIMKIPEGMNLEEGATLPMPYMTAYYSLITRGNLQKGERVLIHSAAGGVGWAAVKIAQWKGAEIFATAGTEKKREYLKSMGVPHVMDSRSLDFADEVMQITAGKGVDVILNSLSGEFIAKNLSLLGEYGRFLEIGVRDINENYQMGLRPFLKGLAYFAIIISSEIPNILDVWDELRDHFRSGVFTPLPYRSFPITHVTEAFKYMLQGEHIGKIVIPFDSKSEVMVTEPSRQEQKVDASGKTVPLYARDAYAGDVPHFLQEDSSSGVQQKTEGPGEDAASPIMDLTDGILPREGLVAFKRILQEKLPQVIVSTRDFRLIDFQEQTRSRQQGMMDRFMETPSRGTLQQRPELLTEYVAPRDETEERLARIFENLLGIQVGVNDDFFELGGDSLKASGLANNIQKEFNIAVPVSEIFVKKNISEIAKFLKDNRKETSAVEQILQEVEMLPEG